MKAKVYGAGSVGMHLTQAARRMGWDVTVVDVSLDALERMKNEMYPARYGAWDREIKLRHAPDEPVGDFDIIMVGTPPDVRMQLAVKALSEKPRLLHLEKPLCTPGLEGLRALIVASKNTPDTMITEGYIYPVGESMEWIVVNFLGDENPIGEILTLDVEMREHWAAVFDAHPWLVGPHDSYLGYWRRGGGAGGEHSHGLHLWLYLADVLGWGFVNKVESMLDVVKESTGAEYDRIATFLLKTENGKIGRVVQDVVTYPYRDIVRLQGSDGFVEWCLRGALDGDVVRWQSGMKNPVQERVFPKKRPDDFYWEMVHYQKLLAGMVPYSDSPLRLWLGVEVMEILHKAHFE
jgi:predicted dehydrogenase